MRDVVLNTQNYLIGSLKRALPKTLLLCGEDASGKNIIVEELSKYYGLRVLDITSNISFDYLLALSTECQPSIIVVNLDALSDKKQNAILKFIEEPPKNYNIILLCDNYDTVLPTVKNRCVAHSLYSYKYEDLSRFLRISDEITKLICKTPGDVDFCNSDKYEPSLILAKKIVDKIGIANIPNVLSISDMVDFGDEDKIPYNQLLKLTSYFVACSKNIEIKNRISALNQIKEFKQKLKNAGVNKKMAFEILLLELKDTLK